MSKDSQEDEKAVLAALDGIIRMPVSYTHLDVYKRQADTTADEIADIVSEHCPPVVPNGCDRLSCRTCWLAWLTTGEPPKEKGPSDARTAPGEEGLHPNLSLIHI